MIVLIGETLELSYEEQISNIIKCLEAAVPIIEKENITLLLEPLNDFDRKNYFLPRSKEVFEIIKQINSPNAKILLDLYHEQLMAGNLINTIKENLPYIGHIHVADVPGRHEPGTGEIHYKEILKQLKEIGYKEYVGFEFRSTIDSGKLIAYMEDYQI
jgi:hydroxypyruvate isomerase